MLTFENVQLRVGGFSLLANFTVNAGAQVSILGPSGAGKSTLLSAIAGFLPASTGRILWNSEELTNIDPGDRPVSMLFQDNNLFPHLTAAQNVGLGRKPSLRLSPDDQTKVDDALSRVGLRGMGARHPAELSGGQQSRVALARMLVQNKPIVLLDEPFAALGPGLRAEMLDLVKELVTEQGATLLMVTHDPSDAQRLAGHTIFVDQGAANAPVETVSLLSNPTDALRRYLN